MCHRTVYYLSSILRHSVCHSSISLAKQSHAQLLLNNHLSNITLQTDLLLAYSKCGFLPDARKVFDRMPARNMHSWNILISSYVQSSLYFDSVCLFKKFLEMGFRPDHYTLPPLLNASARLGDSYLGQMLHCWVIRLGFEGYVVVGSCVMDFYMKCGRLNDAKIVFSEMKWRDSGVWNSMISGIGKAGCSAEALGMFRNMLGEGVEMDAMTVPCVLNACGGEGDLIKGREIHAQVIKSAVLDGDVAIGNSLIDMYARCGHLHDSVKAFRNMRHLNLVSWTAMISCYGIHGKGKEGLALFGKMKERGFRPNPVTLTAVLAGCSHSGLVDEAQGIFNSIFSDYGFQPSIEHYACMVDLLSRVGYLEEALGLIQTMKLAPIASVWGALLGGCVMHKQVQIGEIAAYHLFKLEPRNSSNYIALCSIYESHGSWDDVSRIRAKMRAMGLIKTPGCSWITISGSIHKFFQGDLSHRPTRLICEELDGMVKEEMWSIVSIAYFANLQTA